MKTVHWVVAALHKARRDEGMSREEVAVRVARTAGAVRSWETGVAEPSLASIEAWAATHGLYLTLSGERPAPAPLAAQAEEMILVVAVRRMLASGHARRVRENAGLSLREAGSAAGVDAGAIHRWENGTARPQPATAVLYGRFLQELQNVLALTADKVEEAS